MQQRVDPLAPRVYKLRLSSFASKILFLLPYAKVSALTFMNAYILKI